MDDDQQEPSVDRLGDAMAELTELVAAGEIELGGPVERNRATLRFSGDDLVPEGITDLIGANPTSACSKGEVVQRMGRPGPAARGVWCLESECPADVELEQQIRRLLARVTNDLDVWRSLAQYEPDIICGLWPDGWNRELELQPDLLLELGRRGIILNLDIYCD